MNAIGLDIGTTTICAVVVDEEDGSLKHTVTLANDTFLVSTDCDEKCQDVQRILTKALAVVQELLEQYFPIRCIGVTGQMHGIVYLDVNGDPVSPLYTWQDARANRPLSNGTHSYCDEIQCRTGYTVAAGYGNATHFYNANNGLVPANAACYCTIHDLIAMKLAGLTRPIMHSSNAASFGLFNQATGQFDAEAMKAIGLDIEMLPAVTSEPAILGSSTKGFEVAIAIGDNQASFIGSIREENALLINIGTGSQVSALAKSGASVSGCEIRPLYAQRHIVVGSALCGGRSYSLLENFLRSCGSLCGVDVSHKIYDAIDALAMKHIDEPALKVSTLFCGTRQAPHIRGSIEGIGLDNLTPQHVILGFLNGMIEELQSMYQSMEGQLYSRPVTIVGSGNGIRRTEPLRILLERHFGMRLRIPAHTEEAAFGAVLFSLAACGRYEDLPAAQQALIKYLEE